MMVVNGYVLERLQDEARYEDEKLAHANNESLAQTIARNLSGINRIVLQSTCLCPDGSTISFQEVGDLCIVLDQHVVDNALYELEIRQLIVEVDKVGRTHAPTALGREVLSLLS